MTSPRRIGAASSATRVVILDATEQLMVNEGYAAVSTRRVARNTELTAALVHYYFPTTDDLLFAVYRRAAERNLERLSNALNSDQPLQALWKMSIDPARTVLAAEFMALANHRKVIGAEIARNIERSRRLHAEAFSRVLGEQLDNSKACAPAGLGFLLAAASRALVMEQALGISAGHVEAVTCIEWWLQHWDAERGPATSKSAPRRRRKKTERS